MTEEEKQEIIDAVENSMFCKANTDLDIVYLGFGEYYNRNTKKFLRVSDGAFMRFPEEMYENAN